MEPNICRCGKMPKIAEIGRYPNTINIIYKYYLYCVCGIEITPAKTTRAKAIKEWNWRTSDKFRAVKEGSNSE